MHVEFKSPTLDNELSLTESRTELPKKPKEVFSKINNINKKDKKLKGINLLKQK